MTLPRWIKRTLWSLLILALLVVAIAGAGWWYFHPGFERTNGLVYGHRGSGPLALDVIRPRRTNGLGILMLVSGGWRSGEAGKFPAWMVAPVLRHGYTVFPVYHVSQPKSSVMEIVQDMHRAVRFVRHHAAEYGIDPRRLGVTGGSAGGHLSLMLATRGGPGSPDAPDPIDRESSAVQAVAIFYPVTDLINLGTSTENLHDGGPPKSFRRAFGPDGTNLTIWPGIGRDLSPIYHVTTNLPPMLIYHGDADTLVPLDQSQRFAARAAEVGRPLQLVVHPGGAHGWLSMPLDIVRFADWFDRNLAR